MSGSLEFKAQMAKFVKKCETRKAAVVIGGTKAALNSIKYGSDITGAPGQPVQDGDLRESWTTVQEGPDVALIYTDSPYAPPNEDGVDRVHGGPYQLRSSEGGRWSVYKTKRNFERLIRYVMDTLDQGARNAK